MSEWRTRKRRAASPPPSPRDDESEPESGTADETAASSGGADATTASAGGAADVPVTPMSGQAKLVLLSPTAFVGLAELTNPEGGVLHIRMAGAETHQPCGGAGDAGAGGACTDVWFSVRARGGGKVPRITVLVSTAHSPGCVS